MVGFAEVGDGPLFGVLAHLDVVPEGKPQTWERPPFSAEEADGRIYGRGATDDKGPAVSALYAIKALMDSGKPLNRRFRVIVGLDEESGFRCMERYKRTEEMPEAAFSPDANFPLVNAEKGILHFKLLRKFDSAADEGRPRMVGAEGGVRVNMVPDELRLLFCGAEGLESSLLRTGARVVSDDSGLSAVYSGVSAHAMEPWLGENAIYKFLSSIELLDFGPAGLRSDLIKLRSLFKSETRGESLGVACGDDISGPLSCNLAMMSMSDETLSVSCDIRYPVTVSGASVIEKLNAAASSIGWELAVINDSAPLFVSPGADLVRTLLDAYEAITGERGEPLAIGGGTYSRAMPNTVSFGGTFPGEEDLAHQANESVSLDSLRRMTHIYAEAVRLFNLKT
jgi:succinyl-diaminopimelate desuccinylase